MKCNEWGNRVVDESQINPRATMMSGSDMKPEYRNLAFLFVVKGSAAGMYHRLTGHSFIGSSRSCQVIAGGDGVDPVHAQVLRLDGRFWLHDLYSSTGIKVNGNKIDHLSEIKDRDVITLGEHELMFLVILDSDKGV